MKSANHAFFDRERMIVLHELHMDSRLFQRSLVVGFGKEASLIKVPGRLDDLHVWYFSRTDLHYSSAALEISRDAVAANAGCGAATGISTLFAPPCATRLLARSRDSNVPASVHHPFNTL